MINMLSVKDGPAMRVALTTWLAVVERALKHEE